MSKLRFPMAIAAIAALSCVSTARAQEVRPGARSDTEVERSERGGITNSRSDGQWAQGPTVEEALIKKLTKANDAEIELAKMAQEKTNNAALKQFTQMIIQDHQACNQQLQKLNGHSSSTANGSDRNATDVSDRRPADSQRLNSDRNASGRNAENDGTHAKTSHVATVPPQLCQIMERACENSLMMTKKMLGSYEGQEFEMAFLGQQMVMHTMMLAELEAIQSDGPTELKSFASAAIGKVEGHLSKAKSLAEQLEGHQTKQAS